MSTLSAIVEQGFGLRLEIEFRSKNSIRPNLWLPPIPRHVEEVVRRVAALPESDQAEVLDIRKTIVALMSR